MSWQIHNDDCVDKMATMPDCSVDSIVTDPPYGLAFMGKAFDKLGNKEAQAAWHQRWTDGAIRVLKPGGHIIAFGGTRTYHWLALAVERSGFEVRDSIHWIYGSGFPKNHKVGDGLGTALKPAHEPAILARKPTEGSVTNNVQTHGTGALRIEDCRVGVEVLTTSRSGSGSWLEQAPGAKFTPKAVVGRWPANLIHDGSAQACSVFPDVAKSSSGTADRFFHCAKPTQAERHAGCGTNTHVTVKPVELMRYLCRLVTPKGGVVLDPFTGSGTTGIAAQLEGLDFIGCEIDKEYYRVAVARVKRWRRFARELNRPAPADERQGDLF